MAKKWLGKVDKCDICGLPFDSSPVDLDGQKVFIDGRTTSGTWALMCGSCFVSHGVGIGLGRGQVYNLGTKEKIAG